MAATTPTTQTARKAHRCSICSSTIHAGTVYERWRYFDEGDTIVVKVHPDCWGLFKDYDVSEWTDGDTFTELLTGNMFVEEAQEAIDKCKDTDLRALWQKWFDAYLRDSHDADQPL